MNARSPCVHGNSGTCNQCRIASAQCVRDKLSHLAQRQQQSQADHGWLHRAAQCQKGVEILVMSDNDKAITRSEADDLVIRRASQPQLSRVLCVEARIAQQSRQLEINILIQQHLHAVIAAPKGFASSTS